MPPRRTFLDLNSAIVCLFGFLEVDHRSGVAPPDGYGQGFDRSLPPAFLDGLPADVLAAVPMELDQDDVDGR